MFLKYLYSLLAICLWMIVIYGFLMLPYFFKNTESEEKSLYVYTWAHRIDEGILRDFEKKTGIKVYLNYYESNEELLTKLEMMPTAHCDIMLPSGYIIEPMIRAGLIKKLDKDRCPWINKIYPEFLHMYFDPNNEYSLPLYWDVFGIGYNKNIVGNRPITLDMIFDRQKVIGGQIAMTEDARESIFLAASYLGLPLRNLSAQQLDQIYDLLRKQKEWVGSYTDSQQGYFLSSETFAVVVSDRETVCRKMLQYDFIKFVLLPTGSMLRTDSVVISVHSKKDDMIYEFLEFLFSKQVLQHHCEKYCILPTTQEVLQSLDSKYIGVDNLYPGSDEFKKLIVFDHGLTQKEINDFWIKFKAS
ncbi:MAG TPA: extracellular solute-binding protein [Candidatus Saccharimonadales bacterium]|nr:extracellular solute-binding protein [Candidatus Saccharimonadales bacterium]